jgi:hypothetical protein
MFNLLRLKNTYPSMAIPRKVLGFLRGSCPHPEREDESMSREHPFPIPESIQKKIERQIVREDHALKFLDFTDYETYGGKDKPFLSLCLGSQHERLWGILQNMDTVLAKIEEVRGSASAHPMVQVLRRTYEAMERELERLDAIFLWAEEARKYDPPLFPTASPATATSVL